MDLNPAKIKLIFYSNQIQLTLVSDKMNTINFLQYNFGPSFETNRFACIWNGLGTI